MLVFAIVTILFWLFGVAFSRFMLKAIGAEQFIDVLFGWQKMLDRMYGSNNKYVRLFEKFLGGCDMCFMHHMTIWVFAMYAVFCHLVLDLWVSDFVNSFAAKIAVNIIWYLVFVVIGWFLSMKFNSED